MRNSRIFWRIKDEGTKKAPIPEGWSLRQCVVGAREGTHTIKKCLMYSDTYKCAFKKISQKLP